MPLLLILVIDIIKELIKPRLLLLFKLQPIKSYPFGVAKRFLAILFLPEELLFGWLLPEARPAGWFLVGPFLVGPFLLELLLAEPFLLEPFLVE